MPVVVDKHAKSITKDSDEYITSSSSCFGRLSSSNRSKRKSDDNDGDDDNVRVKLYAKNLTNNQSIPIQTTLSKLLTPQVQKLLCKKDNSTTLALDQFIVKGQRIMDINRLYSSVQLLSPLHLSSISKLLLIEAQLSQFPSSVVSMMTGLVELNLSHNDICVIPDDIDTVVVSQQLQTLNISANRIEHLPKSLTVLFERGLQTLEAQENFIQLDMLPAELKSKSFKVRKYWHNQHVAQEIIPRLYLGSIHSAKNKQFLTQNSISHILSVNVMNPIYPDEFTYKIVREEDQPQSNIIQHFESCFEFIESVLSQDSGSVLVHCAAGQSRSATIVIAYIMYKHHVPFEEAFNLVLNKRCCISPNDGFLRQLQLFGRIGMQYKGELFQQYVEDVIQSSAEQNTSLLDLCYLRLTDLPSSIHHYQWKRMFLTYNQLTSVDDLAPSTAAHLVELHASHNLIDRLSPSLLSAFSSLQVLNLSHNRLSEVPLAMFQYLNSLLHLNLSHNQLTLIPPDIENWKDHLQVLELSHNSLCELPGCLISLTKLKTLGLAHNCFAKGEPELLQSLRARNTGQKGPMLIINFLPPSQREPPNHE